MYRIIKYYFLHVVKAFWLIIEQNGKHFVQRLGERKNESKKTLGIKRNRNSISQFEENVDNEYYNTQ